MSNLIGMSPHPAQVNILTDPTDAIIVASSRRFGKTQTAFMFLLRVCLDFDQWIASRGNAGYQISATSPAIVAVVLPTRAMAKALYWVPLMKLIEQQPAIKALVENINNTELTISWKGNRPDVVFGGSAGDDGDRWRGRKIVALVVDEAQDQSFSAIQDVLKIAMADVQGSQMLSIGTPKGRGNNTLWKLRLLARDFPQYYSFHHYTAYDNPYFSREAILKERLTKTPAVFKRELLADFLDFPGKVFTELSESNLVEKPEGDLISTLIGVDWGSKNGAIVVLGLYEHQERRYWLVLDTWQNKTGDNVSGSEFNKEVLRLFQEYKPVYVFCDPSRPDSVLDLRGLGIRKALTGYNPIAPGLGQLSNLIYNQQLLFLDNLQKHSNHVTGRALFELFSSYHYQEDKDGIVTENIKDGQDDHCIDAIRMILAVKDPRVMTKALTAKKTVKKVTLEDMTDAQIIAAWSNRNKAS